MLTPRFGCAVCAVLTFALAPFISDFAAAQTQSTSTLPAGIAPASAASSASSPTKAELKAQRKAERKQARAKKNAELKRLEDSGYQPALNDPNYPQNLQNAAKTSGTR
ncbi:DUF4148 domain-containing protein [Paraburkholderia sp. J12]|uniref:DUF4148 domain-containing protein n=1 Tax=Paraburkholderia sp. J12 TaxID=2805432 RepID=UPI002ABD5106|nr:DUF4148 domain-containing protein [Paraburkholderia sp. J12]